MRKFLIFLIVALISFNGLSQSKNAIGIKLALSIIPTYFENDRNLINKSILGASPSFCFYYEKQMNKNIFIEIGVRNNQYILGFSTNPAYELISPAYSFQAMSSIQFPVLLKYKYSIKSGFFIAPEIGIVPGLNLSYSSTLQTETELYGMNYYLHQDFKKYFSLYQIGIDIGKDFYTNSFLINFAYVGGFRKLIQGEVKYRENTDDSWQNAIIFSKGQCIMTGISYQYHF